MATTKTVKRRYEWRPRSILVNSQGDTKLSAYLRDLGIDFETKVYKTDKLEGKYSTSIYEFNFEATRPMYDHLIKKVLDKENIVGTWNVNYY